MLVRLRSSVIRLGLSTLVVALALVGNPAGAARPVIATAGALHAFPDSHRAGTQDPAARAGARKAVPITRGQELGLRFRPDERDPVDGHGGSRPTTGSEALASPDDQSQFRPTERRRRLTYEELQAAENREAIPVPAPVPAPVLPYPALPPPLPPYAPFWPN